MGLHLAFRLHYYGEWLPNTAVLKLGSFSLIYRLLNGIGFVLPFLQCAFPLMMLAAYSLLCRHQMPQILLGTLFGVSVVYQVYAGGDPWSYWRIMSPTIPMLIVLAIDGAALLSEKLIVAEAPLGRNSQKVVLCSMVMLWALFTLNDKFLDEQCLLRNPFDVDGNIENVNVAYALKKCTTADATVGVFWAGSIPFYSERYAVDFLGKCDKQVARLKPDLTGAVAWAGMRSVPGHNKYNLNYSILEKRPTYVQNFNTRWGNLSEYGSNNYVRVECDGAKLWLLRDSPSVKWRECVLPTHQ